MQRKLWKYVSHFHTVVSNVEVQDTGNCFFFWPAIHVFKSPTEISFWTLVTLLCLTKYRVMKTWCVPILGVRWRWVVSLTPRPLYSRGKSPGSHRTGGRMGPRAGLDAVANRKNIPAPAGNPAPVDQSQVLIWCYLYQITLLAFSAQEW